MLKLKLQDLGHLIRTANSVEKALMLGKIESRKRRGQQRMRQLDIITDWMDMNLNKHQEILVDREAQHAAVHGVSKSQTRLSDWTRRRRRVAHSISTVLESDSWGLCQNYKPKAMPQRWILVSVDGRHTLVSYSEHGNLHLPRYVCRSMYHFFCLFSLWVSVYKSLKAIHLSYTRSQPGEKDQGHGNHFKFYFLPCTSWLLLYSSVKILAIALGHCRLW